MKSEKRADGWWVVGLPDGPECGPYDRKDEAESDRVGMTRFYQHEDDEEFIFGSRKLNRDVA